MWIWLGIVVLILLLAVILICYSSITVDIFYKRHNKNDMAIIRSTMLYGLIQMEYDLPEMKFEDIQKGLMIKLNSFSNLKQMPHKNEEVQVNERKLKKWADEVNSLLRNTYDLRPWLKKTMKRMDITKLDWSSDISLGDAAHTATFTGVLWTIKTSISGFGSHYVCLKTLPNLQIVPIYTDEPLFSTELHCILRVSFGYAMYAGLMLIVRILKVKGGIKTWKNILFKA